MVVSDLFESRNAACDTHNVRIGRVDLKSVVSHLRDN
jgi:hypothetical protein